MWYRNPDDKFYAMPEQPFFENITIVRSLYARDQREWVKYCDIEIPLAIANAIRFQENGRKLYQTTQELTNPVLKRMTSEMAADSYDEARRYLQRTLYYQATRRVNLPQD